MDGAPLGLTKRQRALLAQVQARHGRRKADVLLVEGVRCCAEALRRRPDWFLFGVFSRSFGATSPAHELAALVRPETGPGAFVAVDDREFSDLADTPTPQGVLCIMRRPDLRPRDVLRDPFALVLDRVQEPGNLGTILRTAWAVGLTEVWLTKGCADPYGPKVVRAGMGAQFALTLMAGEDLAAVREQLAVRGRSPLHLAVPRGGISCWSPEFALAGSALVIGNEGSGVADLGLGQPVSIPMPGDAESLNASQAATVLLFEAVRRGTLPVPLA